MESSASAVPLVPVPTGMEHKVREARRVAGELSTEAQGVSQGSASRVMLLGEADGLECFADDVWGEAAMHQQDVPCLPKPNERYKWVVCTWPDCAFAKPSCMKIGKVGCYTGHLSVRPAYEREVREIEERRRRAEADKQQ